MRRTFRRRVFGAVLGSLILVMGACTPGGDTQATDGGQAPQDGPTIVVASFNFPESVILAEIYAQAMEAQGYPVSKEATLNLGSRELIFPEIESGNIDFLPEYVGSSLAVGFGIPEAASGDTEESVEALREAFAGMGMRVLEPTPGEDKNVFVVTQEIADQGVRSVSDLAQLDAPVLGGPPECEERATCYRGLVESYGLDALGFEAIQETSARVAALENGEITVALLFSTQPVIAERGFVALEEPEGIIAVENIVPVVSEEVIEAYGDPLVELVNSISALITTETLLELNGKVELEAQDPEDVAREWLVENGFLEA